MNPLVDRLRGRPWLPPLLAALLYGGLHLVWYWQTPLGVAPVLDEKENLLLARQITEGTLPAEPFYRAMGYPLLLALFPALGLPAALQPFAATLLGLGLHALNSTLVAILAARLFRSSGAALLAGFLHALNPVLVHYATQILDGTLASSAFLAGLLALLPPPRTDDPDGGNTAPAPREPASDARAAAAFAAAWTAAALIRPQFMLLLPAIPVLWRITRGGGLQRLFRTLVPAALSMLALFAALGAWQAAVSGEFRITPTQGAYNLWAANRPGADGRYFTQSIHLSARSTHENPTLLESRLLYARETGRPSNDPIDQVNAYWRTRLHATLVEAPLAWLRLLARKTYHLFNDFDAYNNKTYAFHQTRSPWLAPNPLGWGVLLVLALPGAFVLAARHPRRAAAIAITFLVVAGGLTLTFVSGRFRLPLTALLCTVAGGLTMAATLAPRTRAISAAGAVLAAIFTFSDHYGARDTRTFLQDELLLAASAVEAGDDATAWSAAGAALERAPGHSDALAWRVTAGFNRLLADALSANDEIAWRVAAAQLIEISRAQIRPPPAVLAIAGLALWRGGKTTGAVSFWRERAVEHRETASWAAWTLAHFHRPDVVPRPPAAPPDSASTPFDLLLRALSAREPGDGDLVIRTLAAKLFEQPRPIVP